MKNILHIISSTRGAESVSTRLGNEIINRVTNTNPGSTVTTLNLETDPLLHLNESRTNALMTPLHLRTEQEISELAHATKAVEQLLASDIVVISLPFINFGVPSSLKVWLDNIVQAGVTFSYSANGPEGLVQGKKVYIALASGGVYSDGPMAAYDHATPYLKNVLWFIGVTDVEVIRAEGTKIPGIQETSLQKAIESISI
ncbi:FMN-dependent NADH-azoreductase [Flavobacterium sp. Sd200]|uniref:FMN-dependent NADH-azoreductase n=1 Tax=Flavobacterium sp. Sd200 TaxID=2692211 RepID=UPI00136F130F|nr:NAD(P)H-dependent oxidoreductase [Flavobacterium sp. Sd200]MXN92692.1 FMN-dependent NADH-azoreductase [Flavobacterium sp. Sd200]